MFVLADLILVRQRALPLRNQDPLNEYSFKYFSETEFFQK